MGNSETLFKTNLIGYEKQSVDNYLNKMDSEGKAIITELKEKLNSTLELNEKLSNEIENLKKENEINGKTEDYKDFLLERLENIQESMNLDAEGDIRYLRETAAESKISMDDDIKKLNNFFRNIQNNLDILIKTVNIKNSIENESHSKSNYKVIPYKGKCGNKKMLQNDNESEINQLAESDIIREFSNLDEIRNKYIIGKRAGADLINSVGEQIISKDSVLTMELVRKAENEGLLSELIIKMAGPEEEKIIR
ncbi:MAG: hypothetical protein ACM3X7_09550 [Solirubrobacterales bacterium]